jgi:hypothetical protein
MYEEKKKPVGSYDLRDMFTPDLIDLARGCLSHLCKRASYPISDDMKEHEAAIRYFLERSVVKLIRSPGQIADFMEHVIHYHENIQDCEIRMDYGDNIKRTIRYRR